MGQCLSCSRWTKHPSGLCPSCCVDLEMRRKSWRIPWRTQDVIWPEDEEERRPPVQMPKEMMEP